MLLPVFLLLLAGSVVAVQITDASFTWMNEKILYVSSNNPIPAMLKFSFKESTNQAPIQSIVIDAREMHQDIRMQQYYQSISMSQNSCQKINSTYNCSVSRTTNGQPLTLRITNSPVNINFRFFHEGGNITEINKTFTFAFDNTRPLLKFIGTENCHTDGVCYGAAGSPNKIVINFEDAQATFNRKLVAFRLGTEDSIVHECTGLTCYGYASPICDQARTIHLNIINYRNVPSQDDAGNPVDQRESNSIMCDPDKPVITAKKVSSSSGLEAITTKDNIILTVNITESTSPVVNMSVNASNLGEDKVSASCVKVADNFVCTATFKSKTEVSGQYELFFSVRDLAGNMVKDSAMFNLLSVSEQEMVNIWDVKEVKQTTNTMIRRNMAVQRTFMAEIELKSNTGGTPTLVQADAKGIACVPTTENRTGNKGDATLTVLKIVPETNKIYAQITLKGTGLSDNSRYESFTSLEYQCPIKLNTKQGLVFFSTPEQQNVTIKLTLNDAGTLDKYIKTEIDVSKDRIESNRKMYQWYDDTVGQFKSLCSIFTAIDSTSGIISGVEEVLALNTVTAGAAVPTGLAADKISVLSRATGLPFREVCEFMACTSDYNTFALDILNNIPLVNDISEYAGYSNFASTMNPYKSELIAYASLCIPAWIHHQKMRNAIECHYLECLTNGVTNYGATVASCQDQKAFNTCAYNTGAIFDSIPGVSLLRDAGNRLVDIMKDPISLFGTLAPLACALIPEKGTVFHASCNIYVTLTSVPNAINTIQAIATERADPSTNCQVVLNSIDPLTRAWAPVGNYPEGYSYYSSKEVNGVKVTCNQDLCCIGSADCKTAGVFAIPVWNFDRNVAENLIFYDSTGKRLGDTNSMIYTQNAQTPSGTGNTGQGAGQQGTKQSGSGTSSETLTIDLTSDLPRKVYSTDSNNMLVNSDGTPIDLTDRQILLSLGLIDSSGKVNPDWEGKWTDIAANINILQEQKYEQLKGTRAYDYAVELQNKLKERNDFLKFNEKIKEALLQSEKIVNDADYFSIGFLGSGKTVVKDGKLTEDGERLKNHLIDTNLYDENSAKSFILNNAGKEDGSSKPILQKLEDEKKYKQIIEFTQKGLDENKKAIKEKESAVKSAMFDLRQAKLFDDYFGSTKKFIKTLWGVGSGLTTFRNMFNAEWGTYSDGSFFGKIRNFIADVTQVEKTICESRISTNRGLGDGVLMNKVGKNTYRNAAYISARRSTINEDLQSGKKTYDYWIEGSVVSYKKSGLGIRLIMYTADGQMDDFTKEVTKEDNPTLYQGRALTFGGLGKSYIFQSEKQYTKACIHFLTTSMSEYFDFVNLNDNKLCQKVVVEG